MSEGAGSNIILLVRVEVFIYFSCAVFSGDSEGYPIGLGTEPYPHPRRPSATLR